MESNFLIRINANDNVAIALKDLEKDKIYEMSGRKIKINTNIQKAHKVAIKSLKKDEAIIKYGQPIGHALCDIEIGDHVHLHNLQTNLDGLMEYKYNKDHKLCEKFKNNNEEVYFEGYVRRNGKVGTRNEVWIIPTVECVNNTTKILERRAQKAFGNRVDGIYALTHNSGCSQLGDDHLRTQQLLKGLINNPNAGAVLVVSLGCENNNLKNFLPILGQYDPERVKFIVTQDYDNEYEVAMEKLNRLSQYATQFKREKVSAQKLLLGLKCGSSDAFSGITSNPLCGNITDRVVQCGGGSILTEVPEMFGAESQLMKRAADCKIFKQIVDLINNFKEYFIRYNQPIYENPCPGNKKGGITTLEEKSLGCIQKGGTAPIVDVLNYGEPIKKSGLSLLIGSGNDPISCTNLVASGANIVLFTTGNGNPYGVPIPTIKISSNTTLYNHKPNWIDYNAGQILDGESFENVTKDLFQYILDVASGHELTNNEKYGYREISIFKDGVVM
jgi:altronate hydrolase